MILTDEKRYQIQEKIADECVGFTGSTILERGIREGAKATVEEVVNRMTKRCNNKSHQNCHCMRFNCPDCWDELRKEIEE